MTDSTDSTESRIAALAGRQHGVVARSQLLGCGLTSRQIGSRVRSGTFHPLHRGVYLLGHLRGRLEPPHAAKMAAVLAGGDGVLISHRHAGALWKLVPDPGRSAPIHLLLRAGRTPARRRGIVAHQTDDLEPGDAATVDGVPVTSPARTLGDLATTATGREFERAVARAQRDRLVSDEDLQRLVARRGGRRGAALLREVILRDGGPALTESELEAEFIERFRRNRRLPRPLANREVQGHRLDFYWPDRKVAVELDGYAYHGQRPSFRSDRRRDADLLATAGIRVLRFTWEDIVDDWDDTLVALTLALFRGGDA